MLSSCRHWTIWVVAAGGAKVRGLPPSASHSSSPSSCTCTPPCLFAAISAVQQRRWCAAPIVPPPFL
ncbi:hypothetical protein ECG_01532 [Echinococcus granulosus]|uniref:Secreted protein n=1 Tax=Echinococcus granulosus TaxID=6210 RepID=A0A068W7Z4_ECHGR|nr:hypothetical protein ECG_01532 [Echinococcus granulosus]CDS15539.1 hypothetical protein EgrG_002016800 [Echinococcus granulosus]